MQQITYSGPDTSGFHPAIGIVVAAGEVVDVDDEAAEKLLALDVWTKAKATKTKATDVAADTVDGE